MPKEKKYNPVLAKARKDKIQTRKKLKEERAARKSHRRPQSNAPKLEQEITELKHLQAAGKISAHDKALLEELQRQKKALQKGKGRNPYIDSDTKRQREKEELISGPTIPKHPTRSVYYDPVYNPLGVPPPGMPYREWSEEEDTEGSTPPSIAGIPLPPGPLPSLPESELSSASEDELEEETPATRKRPIIESEITSEPAPNIIEPAQLTYSSAPVIRDLRKEAMTMIPSSVRIQRSKRTEKPKSPTPERVERVEPNTGNEPPRKKFNAAPDVDIS